MGKENALQGEYLLSIGPKKRHCKGSVWQA